MRLLPTGFPEISGSEGCLSHCSGSKHFKGHWTASEILFQEPLPLPGSYRSVARSTLSPETHLSYRKLMEGPRGDSKPEISLNPPLFACRCHSGTLGVPWNH